MDNLYQRTNGNTHFWHFFMSDFVYTIYLIITYKPNTLFILTPKETNYYPLLYLYDNIRNDLKPTEIVIEKFNKQKHNNHIRAYRSDRGNKKFSDEIISKSVEWLKLKTINYYGNYIPKEYDTIIQLRKNDKKLEDIYTRNNQRYGCTRRSIDDLEKLPLYLKDNYDINAICVSGDGKHIYEQIYPYINCKRMIFCHGAGMVFRLFLDRESKVLEIVPPDVPNKIKDKNSFEICDYMSEQLIKIVITEEKKDLSRDSVFNLDINNLVNLYLL